MPLEFVKTDKFGLNNKLKKCIINFHPNLNFIVGENGSGKSSLLYALSVNSIFVSQTKPEIENFKYFDCEKMNPRIQHHSDSVYEVISHFRSHGEVLMEVIKTLIEEKNENVLILLDEPESGISPWNQRKMLKLIEEVSEKNQLIIATHSPILTNTNIGNLIYLRSERKIEYYNKPLDFKWGL